MHLRLVLTYFNPMSEKTFGDWHFIPKEAHIDNPQGTREVDIAIIETCCNIVEKQYNKLMKMLPKHLKNKEFEVIIHGEYLTGYDHFQYRDRGNCSATQRWNSGVPIFNITQLGLPEKDRPIIKTS